MPSEGNAIQHAYSPLPQRVRAGLEEAFSRLARVDELIVDLPQAPPRALDTDGDREQLGNVTVTHRIAEAPGDGESVRRHYAEAGPSDGPVSI